MFSIDTSDSVEFGNVVVVGVVLDGKVLVFFHQVVELTLRRDDLDPHVAGLSLLPHVEVGLVGGRKLEL